MLDIILVVLRIFCFKSGSFYTGLHETAGVLRREANLPDPRPEANPMSTPTNRKVSVVNFFLLLFCCSFLLLRVVSKTYFVKRCFEKMVYALNFKKTAILFIFCLKVLWNGRSCQSVWITKVKELRTVKGFQ